MANPGDEVSSPLGVSAEFLRTADDSNGHALELRWTIEPGKRLVALPHRHPSGPEHFAVDAGEVGFRCGGKHKAKAGDSWTVPTNTPHVHPWNVGDEPAVVRQWVEWDEPRHELTKGVELYFETWFALSQQGKVDRIGRVKNPLQDALTLWENLVPGSYVAYLPTPLQRGMFGSMAAIAKRRGYSATIEPEWE